MILHNEGGKIVQQKKIYHGFQSKIKVNSQSKIFKNNQNFKVGRYHSLKLREPFNSETIRITMRCSLTNIPMGLEDDRNKIYGFQFHPESFLTENGNTLIKKILSVK
jgi:anthranilate/para-aminobenzoate synthase component II